MDVRVQTGWDNDPAGRIRNLSLAPNAKNSLFPLFEAVMNSIHAVEDRFGKDNLSKGEVLIELHRTETGDMEGFTVSDNGTGFNESNLASFRRMDSRAKEKIGGKGVGRLVWLKVLDEVHIKSIYDDGSSGRSVSFDFKVSNPTDNLTFLPADRSTAGSIVQLTPYKREYALHIPKKARSQIGFWHTSSATSSTSVTPKSRSVMWTPKLTCSTRSQPLLNVMRTIDSM